MTEFKKTGSTLIWASTTPENGFPWGKVGDSAAYNSVAAIIMKWHGISINDLYSYVKENKLYDKIGDCHFSADASAKLAVPIAGSILQALKVLR